MYYAQITNGVVTAITETHGEYTTQGMIPLGTFDTSLLGYTWDGNTFTAPEPVPAPADPCEWLIDLGPFYDRFGAAKMAVLTSADAGVKAIIADLNIRKWVDLQRADVATGLAYVGTHVPSVDAALQAAILTTPVTAEENRALRKLYF
jgi:hypothetical protein